MSMQPDYVNLKLRIKGIVNFLVTPFDSKDWGIVDEDSLSCCGSRHQEGDGASEFCGKRWSSRRSVIHPALDSLLTNG